MYSLKKHIKKLKLLKILNEEDYVGLIPYTFHDYMNHHEEGTVYERMAVKPEDFLKFEIMLPSIEEQVAIAEILLVVDKEIDLLRQDLEQEKQIYFYI